MKCLIVRMMLIKMLLLLHPLFPFFSKLQTATTISDLLQRQPKYTLSIICQVDPSKFAKHKHGFPFHTATLVSFIYFFISKLQLKVLSLKIFQIIFLLPFFNERRSFWNIFFNLLTSLPKGFFIVLCCQYRHS